MADIDAPFSNPDDDQLRAHFQTNIDAAREAHPEGKEFTFADAVKAGWQGSSTGLLVRGALPDTQLPEDAPAAQRILSKLVGLAGDLPEMAAGTVAGLATAGPFGGSAAAFALPTAMREFLMDRYAKGQYQDAGDMFNRAGPILMDTARSAVLGAATAGVGKFAGIASEGLSPAAQFLATSGSEVTALTGLSAAMAGKVPTARDFIDNAILIGGAHLAGRVAGKLRDIYTRVGTVPEKVTQAVADSPPLQQALVSEDPGIPRELAPLVEKAETPPAMDTAGADASPPPDASTPAEEPVLEPTDPIEPTAANLKLNPTLEEQGPNIVNIADLWAGGVPSAPEEAVPETPPKAAPPQAPASQTPAQSSASPQSANPAPGPGGTPPPGAPPPGSTAAALATVLSRKATGPVVTPKMSWGQVWDRFYTSVVDDLHPIKRLAQQLSQGKVPDLRAYVLANLTRGSLGLSTHWLEHRPIGADGKPIAGAEALRTILSDVVKETSVTGAHPIDEFEGYLMSERSAELAGRMKDGKLASVETGIDPAAATQVAKDLAPTYKQYADRIYAYKNHLLDYVRDSGVLSDEAVQAIKDANRAHVPFYRAFGDQEGGPRVGTGATNPVKAIRGSDLQIESPLASIVKDTHTFIKAAENNTVGQALAKLHDVDPDNGLMTKVDKRSMKISVTADEVTNFIRQHGVSPDPNTGFDIFRQFRDPLADNEIAVYRDGTREVYQVPDDAAEAIKGLDRSGANILTKVLSAPAMLERAGMTGALDFGLRHIVRSNILAPIISENQHFPLVGMIKGLGALFDKGDLYEKWITSGAYGSTAADLSRETLGGKVFDLSRQTGLMDSAMNIIRHPLDSFLGMSHALVSTMDTGLRLGEFQAALENGKSIEDAALSSRQIGLDYARAGTYTRGLNRIVAFQNAGIQGLDTVVRAAAANPAAVLAKGMLYIGLPTLANWYANRNDSRYQTAPQWQKDLFWVIPTDKWEPSNEAQASMYPDDLKRTVDGGVQVNNGVTFRIPKPFEPGVAFGSLIERMLDRFVADNPRAFEQFDHTLFHALPGVIPTAFQPIIEQWANKSILTGNPLVNHAAEKLLPEYRYNDYTSETAKLLGKFGGVVPYGEKLGLASPAIIDHYIQGWTGTLGKYAVQVADKALQASGVTNPPPAPESTLADVPFVKAFIVRHPSAGMEPIEEFHQRFEQASEHVDTLKQLAKDGNFDAYQKLLGIGSDVPPKLQGISSALSNLGQLIHAVNLNPQMAPSDKRQLIDGYYYQMAQLARSGNETSRAFEEAMKGKGQ